MNAPSRDAFASHTIAMRYLLWLIAPLALGACFLDPGQNASDQTARVSFTIVRRMMQAELQKPVLPDNMCFAVQVTETYDPMPNASCVSKTFAGGIIKGLVPKGGEVEVTVPVGTTYRFMIIGYAKSEVGNCDGKLEIANDKILRNGQAFNVRGHALAMNEVKIMPGDNTVEMYSTGACAADQSNPIDPIQAINPNTTGARMHFDPSRSDLIQLDVSYPNQVRRVSNDFSTEKLEQASSYYQPTLSALNGTPIFDFSAFQGMVVTKSASEWDAREFMAGDQVITMAIKPNGDSAWVMAHGNYGAGPANTFWSIRKKDNFIEVQDLEGESAGKITLRVRKYAYTSNEMAIVSYAKTGLESKLFVNGKELNVASSSSRDEVADPSQAAADKIMFHFGSNGSATELQSNHLMGDALVYDWALPSDQRAGVECFEALKYGVSMERCQ